MASSQKLGMKNDPAAFLHHVELLLNYNFLVKEDGRYVIINQEGRSIPLKVSSAQKDTPEPKKYIVKSNHCISTQLQFYLNYKISFSFFRTSGFSELTITVRCKD